MYWDGLTLKTAKCLKNTQEHLSGKDFSPVEVIYGLHASSKIIGRSLTSVRHVGTFVQKFSQNSRKAEQITSKNSSLSD